MEFLAELRTPIAQGLLLGGLYALVALGLSLVFGVVRVINVAHGDLVIFGSYFAFFAASGIFGDDTIQIIEGLHMNPILSLVIGIPLMFGIGFVIQRYLLNRAMAISMEAPLIIAFGISLIIQNFNQFAWSPQLRGLMPFAEWVQTPLTVGNWSIGLSFLLDFIAAIIVMLLLREFLRRTYLGKAINAASQDRRAAQLMGINTTRVHAFAFGIAMICAAIAGVFLGLTYPFTPMTGVQFLILAFGVCIIGGLGNILGTFVGGIILGLAWTLGGYFLVKFGLNIGAQSIFAYAIVLIVLALRPQGIFGR